MSAAHTVKPSASAADSESVAGVTRRSRLNLIALGALAAALGLVGAAGSSHLRARRTPVMQIVSGSPVLKKSEDGDSVRWHAKKATLYFDSSLNKLGDQAREAVQLGFGSWLSSGAKLPGLSFDSTKDAKFGTSPNGKSEVMYGPITISGHENDLALTITFSDPKTGEVLESDMIFNSNHAYGLLSANGGSGADGSTQTSAATVNASVTTLADCDARYDLQSVATHEAGHFFGLGEDYNVKTATMYYTTGRCETNKRALQTSDETTMDALYVANETSSSADSSTDTGKGCGGARIGQGTTGGKASLFALLSLLGFVSLRRHRR